MIRPAKDHRSPQRQEADDQIAAEPPLPPPDLRRDAQPEPVEAYLARLARRPRALAGIVQNGAVRPVDPNVKLPENTRVIIVMTEEP